MEPPDGAETGSNIARSERVSIPPEAMQQDWPDDALQQESGAGSQQDNVPEPMQHDTPDDELKHESQALKNENIILSDVAGSEQVSPSDAMEHHAANTKLVHGSETAGSQHENVPEPMQHDTPDEELKHESQALKNEKTILSDGAGSKQVNPSEAVEHHATDSKLGHGSETGNEQANLPEPKQRDRPDDKLKRDSKPEKKVTLVYPPGTGHNRVNSPEAVEHGKLYDVKKQGSKTGTTASREKRNVVTLKDIDAEPWYNSSEGQYKEALQEGRSAATKLWTKVALWKGDITKLEVDAIVNAANSRLLGGGGVDGAIHAAAGPNLKEECRGLKGCAPGDAKITKGYKLPAKHVIHTVGPMDGNPEVLKRCYLRCFRLMADHQLKSVAFPCIATGIYGFPNDDAAEIALSTARVWLEQHHAEVEKIVFCVFLPMDFELYKERLPVHFSPNYSWSRRGSIGHEAGKSDQSVAKEDVVSDAGNRQLAEVHRVGEIAGSEHTGEDVLLRDPGATAAAVGTDASDMPANSAAVIPAGAEEVTSSVAEAAVDVSDQSKCGDGCCSSL